MYSSLQLPAKKATWEINSCIFPAKRFTSHFSASLQLFIKSKN